MHLMSFSLRSESKSIERFFSDLRENLRGWFLRITEDVNGRRDTIILPSTGFQEFAAAFARVTEAH
jgi:hypothetical protein